MTDDLRTRVAKALYAKDNPSPHENWDDEPVVYKAEYYERADRALGTVEPDAEQDHPDLGEGQDRAVEGEAEEEAAAAYMDTVRILEDRAAQFAAADAQTVEDQAVAAALASDEGDG